MIFDHILTSSGKARGLEFMKREAYRGNAPTVRGAKHSLKFAPFSENHQKQKSKKNIEKHISGGFCLVFRVWRILLDSCARLSQSLASRIGKALGMQKLSSIR